MPIRHISEHCPQDIYPKDETDLSRLIVLVKYVDGLTDEDIIAWKALVADTYGSIPVVTQLEMGSKVVNPKKSLDSGYDNG